MTILIRNKWYCSYFQIVKIEVNQSKKSDKTKTSQTSEKKTRIRMLFMPIKMS